MIGPSTEPGSFRSNVDYDSDDDEDETAELQRELEKIKRERAEKREQEVRTRFESPERHVADYSDAGAGEGSAGRGCEGT